jgi:glycosyltransferase EpsH
MDKVSIIVPVYNVEAYLEKCMETLLNQTHRNCEFIFVDDGSPDHCADILERYAQKDQRIRVIHQENQGLSGARNTGLEAATGDYVVFQDSDDWLDETAVETALRFSKEKDLDIVLWSYASEYEGKSVSRPLLGDAPIVWEDAHKIHRRIVGLVGSELAEPHKADACVTAWGKLYRRSVVENVRFVDTKRIGTEDALFNTYAFGNAGRVGYLPDIFSHYRKTNETSLTSGYKARLHPCWATLYQMMGEYLDSISASEDYYTALSNRVCLSMIGIGLNELHNPAGFFTKSRNLRHVLKKEPWATAYKKLDLKAFPLKWKVFFFLCKHAMTELLLLMLYTINFLRGIVSN